MMSLTVAIDFSRTPGSRYASEGDFSGEQFRNEHLAPQLEMAVNGGDTLTVNLDGTAGFGTSFLEEAFGGLVRDSNFQLEAIRRTLKVVSTEEPYLVDDIWEYIVEAAQGARGGE